MPLGGCKASLFSGIKLLFGFSHKKSGIFSAGNGPAMRVSVLGLLCEDNEKLKEFVKRTTYISHTAPKAYRGALAIAVAAKFSLKFALQQCWKSRRKQNFYLMYESLKFLSFWHYL